MSFDNHYNRTDLIAIPYIFFLKTDKPNFFREIMDVS